VAATGIEVGRKRALPWADLLHPEDLADALATYRTLEPHQSATVMARLRTARTGPGLMPHAVCLVEQDMRTRVRRYLGVMRSVAPVADDWTAKAIDQLKGSILSTMSHEFRTPLTAILGFAELLTEETDSTQRHLAERIEHSAHRLLRTLGDILDLAQIENQLMPFQKEATDFAIHVSTVAAPFVHAAIAKGLSWRFLEPESPVSVAIDTEASARALKHVFDNAVKFTEQGGVELTLIVRSEEALLSITDTGIGMGEEFLPHAFEEFRQENGDIVRPFEGSGLGLALAKKLVMALAGRVEIASRKGVGTTVTIVYPLAPTA
jgi:signal transduction histidine kinase